MLNKLITLITVLIITSVFNISCENEKQDKPSDPVVRAGEEVSSGEQAGEQGGETVAGEDVETTAGSSSSSEDLGVDGGELVAGETVSGVETESGVETVAGELNAGEEVDCLEDAPAGEQDGCLPDETTEEVPTP